MRLEPNECRVKPMQRSAAVAFDHGYAALYDLKGRVDLFRRMECSCTALLSKFLARTGPISITRLSIQMELRLWLPALS